MKQIPIEEIVIDTENRLLIRPKLGPEDNYEYIYRDASGVTWIEKQRCLGASEPERWNHFDIFRQIIMAVRGEYGELLAVTSETKWTNIPTALKHEIQYWRN